MKHVSRVETFDGVLHLSQKDAKRHLDKLYGDKLLAIGRELAPLGYGGTTEWIDTHLPQFLALDVIRQDMAMQPCPRDDD